MSIDGTLTVGAAITQAMRRLGVLEGDSVPTNDQISDGVSAANWMLKSMQADGVNLWRRTQETLTIPAGTAEVTLDPRVLDVPEARVVIPGNTPAFERALGIFSYDQYWTLPTKGASGTPTVFMFNKQQDFVSLFFWMVPTVSTTIKYTAARVVDDVTEAQQTIPLPQEWTEAFIYNLADRLIDTFGTASNDTATAQRITARAANLYQKMLDFDRPSSVFLKPFGTKGRGPIWRP